MVPNYGNSSGTQTNNEIVTKEADTFANLGIDLIFTTSSNIDVTVRDKEPCGLSGGITLLYGFMLSLVRRILEVRQPLLLTSDS